MNHYVISGVNSRRKEDYVDMNPKTGDPEKIAAVNARMLTIDQYHTLARRIIGKWAPVFIKSSMLNSEDAIDFVAHLIMIGDWNFDASQSSLKTHRGNCGKRAIQCYVDRVTKQSQKSMPNLIDELMDPDTNGNAYDILEDEKAPQPSDRMEISEEREEIKKNLSMLLGNLNKTQRACVMMHYIEDMPMAEIGRELNITREGVRRSIAEAIKLMRSVLGIKPRKVR